MVDLELARPIDASVAVVFDPGAQSGTNSFSVFFREAVVDYITMIELNQYSMAELNGRPLPNQGDAKWEPRELSTLEGVDVGDLEGITMRELERQEDNDLLSNFRITIEWGTTPGTNVYGLDSEGNGQSFLDVGDLTDNTVYVALIDVYDNTWRARIYPTSGGVIDETGLIFDTGEVTDDFHVKRRKGKLRLAESLVDPGADVIEMRTRHLNFAEYRSKPMESHTPVAGAQIFAEYTPGVDHFESLLVGPDGGSVAPDKGKTLSGESYRITNLGIDPDQGVVSNVIQFENFNDYRIEFDIWYPQIAIDNGNPVELFLLGAGGGTTKINLGKIRGDSWHHIKLYPVEGNVLLTGSYQLYWRQAATGQATTWWLDNIEVTEESMRWEARAVADDPWGDRKGLWTPFRDLVNSEHDGVILHERGTQLQVRGKALRQDVTLGRVKIKPKYAELGRVVFAENQSPVNLTAAHVPPASDSLWTFDFGSLTKLDRAFIDFESIAPGGLRWEGSIDDATYFAIMTQTTVRGWNEFKFVDKPTYRYLRFRSISGTAFVWKGVIVHPALLPPTAAFTPSVVGDTVTFAAAASTDPDGFIIAYIWNFGDGEQGFGETVKHTYSETGFGYNVTLMVVDNHGNETIYTEEVGV